MREYPYQLTHWLKNESDLDSVIEPFQKYREMEAYIVNHSPKGWAVFTKGDLLDKDYK